LSHRHLHEQNTGRGNHFETEFIGDPDPQSILAFEGMILNLNLTFQHAYVLPVPLLINIFHTGNPEADGPVIVIHPIICFDLVHA
jgi:hypothetical protein